MTLSELCARYYFHDSVLEKIEAHGDTVKLYCQFCNFLQPNYKDTDDSNSDIIVIFHNAVCQTNGNRDMRDASFVTQKTEDDAIHFFMESSPERFGTLIIKASSAQVITVRTYNL